MNGALGAAARVRKAGGSMEPTPLPPTDGAMRRIHIGRNGAAIEQAVPKL